MKMPFSSLWSEFKTFAFKGNMIELAVAVIIGGAFGTVVTSLTNDVIMPSIGYVIHKGEETAAAVKEKTTEAVSVVASKTGLTTQPSTQPSIQQMTQPTTSVVATGTPAAALAPGVPAVPPVPEVKPSVGGVTDAVAIFKELEAEKDAKDAKKEAAGAKAKADADAKAKAAEPIKIDLKLGPVDIGKFIGALLNFLIVAFAVFILVVKVMDGVMKRMSKPVPAGEPTTRECPECLSIIPIKAKRCSHCTAIIEPAKA